MTLPPLPASKTWIEERIHEATMNTIGRNPDGSRAEWAKKYLENLNALARKHNLTGTAVDPFNLDPIRRHDSPFATPRRQASV